MSVAFFGAGLLGSGFVRALARRGEEVRVWNRTRDRAAALEAHGPRAFDDPAECARGAGRVHLSLSDDAAVDEVLERARAGIAPGTLVVDHTTTSPTGTRARAALWDSRGVRFVHAPVFMGPGNALESTGLMLVSGDRARVAEARPAIAPMTGKVIDLGEGVDRAASFKLMGNLFLMFFTEGLAETFLLGKSLGVDPHDAATLFAHFNPGLSIAARIERMLDGDLTKPSWELAMARKDARLMLEEAARAGVGLGGLEAIAAHMDALIARGHGKSDWTVLGLEARDRADR